MKACVMCGEPFYPGTPAQQYCSPACRPGRGRHNALHADLDPTDRVLVAVIEIARRDARRGDPSAAGLVRHDRARGVMTEEERDAQIEQIAEQLERMKVYLLDMLRVTNERLGDIEQHSAAVRQWRYHHAGRLAAVSSACTFRQPACFRIA